MKKILFVAATLIMFLAFNATAQQRGAQEKQTPEQMAARTITRLNEELKLTDTQQAQLKTFFTESFKKRNEVFEKNRENREAIRTQMKKDQEATQAELKKVLTEEQYKTYKANEEKRLQESKKRGQEPRRPGNGYPRR